MAAKPGKKQSDFRRGADLFLRIARKRVQELQSQNVTVREIIDQAVKKGRITDGDVLTPSYLSRILSNKLFPKTEETYDKISAILDIPSLFDVRSFLLPHDKSCIHINNSEPNTHREDWLEINFEGIPYQTPKENIIDAQMFPFLVELKPGEKTKRGKYKAEPGEEMAVLLQGDEFSIRFENGDTYKVQKGESIHYLANNAHYTENTGKQIARILVVRSDPSLYRLISDAFRIAEDTNQRK